jgi:BNR/Asp-box repeat
MLSKLMLFVFSILIVMTLFSCNDNGVSPQQDAGDTTWAQGQGLEGYKVSGFGGSGTNIVVGASHFPSPYVYIFLSTDNGLSWKLQTSFRVDNTIPHTGLIFTPSVSFINDGTVLLAGTWSLPRGDIYRSTNGGITWSDKGINWPENDSDLTENMNCFCLSEGRIFTGTSHGVFVSSDHGVSWTAINIGLYNSNTKRGYAITGIINFNSDLFVCTAGNGIYRSENLGTSWSEVDSVDYDFQAFTSIGANIYVSAFNQVGNTSTGGIFISTNNGNTWQHTDSALVDHSVGPLISNGYSIYAGTDNGIFISSNLGSTWRNISANVVDGVSSLYVYHSYIFTNNGVNIWRYPISSVERGN